MSKDTSVSDSEKSLESWNQSVTRRRGEYSARLKSAHRTSASASLSWPTIRASEYKDTGPIGSKSHDHMLGKGYLCAVVTQEAANWPTPDASNHRDGEVLRKDNNLEQGGFHGVSLHHDMTKYGHPAPANPSTDGSRQGLWPTATVPNGGQTTSGRADKASKRQVRLEHAVSDWPTITAHTPDMESSGPNGHQGTYLAGAVKSWATPRVGGEEKAETRIARGKDIGLHGQVGAMNNTAKLNPRWVETLMGLPVGWVMPSCKSPVTIEPTNFDYSATESCLQQQKELFEFFGTK